MKKLGFTAVVFMLSALLVSGCGGNAVQAYYDPEEGIESAVSKQFVVLIALESNPSTGYSWEAEYDTECLSWSRKHLNPMSTPTCILLAPAALNFSNSKR